MTLRGRNTYVFFLFMAAQRYFEEIEGLIVYSLKIVTCLNPELFLIFKCRLTEWQMSRLSWWATWHILGQNIFKSLSSHESTDPLELYQSYFFNSCLNNAKNRSSMILSKEGYDYIFKVRSFVVTMLCMRNCFYNFSLLNRIICMSIERTVQTWHT